MKNILFTLLFISTSLFAQDYEKNWNKVIEFENAEKVKSANEEVEKIYKKASNRSDEVQMIKCFFYKSKYMQILEEDAQNKILINLKSDINKVSVPSKAILSLVYAECLTGYIKKNYYELYRRTKLDSTVSRTFLTWTEDDFGNEIEKAYSQTVENKTTLRNTPLKNYESIFDYLTLDTFKTENLFDYLAKENIAHYTLNINPWGNDFSDYMAHTDAFLGDSKSFIKLNLDFVKDIKLRKVLSLYQTLEENHSLENQFDRIAFCQNILIRSKSSYEKALNRLQKKPVNEVLLQRILLEKASIYSEEASKKNHPDYNIKAIKVLDSVLTIKNGLNNYYLALDRKQDIISKKLNVEIQKFTYPNENTRAHITYRNVNDVTISFYKISAKKSKEFEYKGKISTDSLVFDLIAKNKPLKSVTHQLINKKDYFQYTTEVLLPQLETGNYLVYFESDNADKTEKSFGYEIQSVSNFMVLANRIEDKGVYQVLNRKTGKPAEDVTIKTKTFEIKTNKKGIATHRQKDNNYRYETLQLISPTDTISLNEAYLNDADLYEEEDEEENCNAKVEFYLDRAIYRPGQTVFYKGIAVQKKKNKSKVIPHLPLKITIKNASYADLKEFEVTTNEFGSFSGEFVLPKDGMTGNFRILAEEPDDVEKDPNYNSFKDEHPFWDYCDNFGYSEFDFKVEEYKRPKFEVTFEKVKEDFVVNQNISIKGNAKAFAGSNISDAKVKYTVERQTFYSYRDYDSDNDETIATGETKTDASGKFTIEFAAKPDESSDKKDLPVFTYKVTADITDVNGETRSNETIVRVGYHSLKLNFTMPSVVEPKNTNNIQISSTNLNNEFTATKGEIKIYFLREFSKKIKQRMFENPEIGAISKEDFERLFPYEIYQKESVEDEKKELVFSKKVDTNLDKTIPIDFIQNYKSGHYKFIFSASDKQNNPVETSSNFEIKQTQNIPKERQLFGIQQLNDNPKKDGFIKLKLTSIVPELHINTTGHYKNAVFFDETIEMKNNEAIIKIPLKKDFYNSVKMGFQTVFDNQNFQQEYGISLKEEEQNLSFETATFRNKIEPGSHEYWSFKLNHKNTPVESEILASMYDSSLDQFTTRDWSDLGFNEYDYNQARYKSVIGFQKATIQIANLNSFTKILEFKNEVTGLMWFGFDFNSVYNFDINKEYKNQLTKKIKKPLNAKTITGTVSDAMGPMPGVNVVVQGTQRGVQTDFDGSYSIAAGKGETLVFSYLGMRDVIREIEYSQVINVIMQDDAKQLGEVVVMGSLGIKKTKSAVTSSSVTVSSENLEAAASPSIVSSLAGKISGLQINTTSGGVNGKTRITLRGNRSIHGDGSVLIVIDGIISTIDQLETLQESDVISTNVFKGTEGTALYGEQGANGVIIITTQKSMQELSQVKARTNLSETAFFFPHLKTDNSGKVSFNFTSPEALTSWKMRLMAHNKNALSGQLEKIILTQKDLMVMPNFPRFFRENDTITINTKIANITGEAKTGIAVLQLFDAATMQTIDVKMMNSNSVKNFSIPALGNTTVSWKIFIPEGLQGVQYKVLAKSGSFSDGEENILPVLTNTILVTESIPIWVRGNTSKEYTFENLKNNDSSTLRNHQFTFEYTSNPTWLAIQSLPYLMEYEHECAEQTFARFYANTLATKIINSNPKIATVFEDWRKNGKLNSKLEENEALKSVLLAETPWLLDAQNEEEKKKSLALLFDLDKMKTSLETTFQKLKQKQKSSGGFAWFDGGEENDYITRHILSGFGHLQKLNSNQTITNKTNEIAKTGIPYIDAQFLETHKRRTENEKNKNKLIWLYPYSDLHYLYTRSFYLKDFPLSENMQKTVRIYTENIKENWIQYSLYEKGMAALILNRFEETSSAKKIIDALQETSANNEDWGMYWIANKAGWYWYQAPIETQALLIEAFAEVNNDTKSVDAMKVWLLKNKQTKNWPTTKSTTEAIYALLLQGTDWLSVKDNTIIKIGDQKTVTKKMSVNEKEAETGYLKLTWKTNEIKKEIASISVENKSKVPGFGGAYWQYFEDLDKIKTNADGALSVSKELYIKKNNGKENELKKITSSNPLHIGDLVTVRLIITSKEDMEFVHLKDMRASCFEPINVLSEYKYENGLGFYMSTKDTAIHLFFDRINKGTYVLEYDIRVNNIGDFSNGITTIQSMYAPEYTSHTKGIRVTTKE